MSIYKFIKRGDEWYIDLPAYLEQGGSMGALQMVDGADTMLDLMAENSTSVSLQISTQFFEGSDLLDLIEICDPMIGGGYYKMWTYEGQEINITMWLCEVTEFVFGHLPDKIYVKREREITN
ncbi:DUF6717 family protein [Paraflavitalea sp. CAU 1676]|uniref:DUF6717 family protein n=1 Tax=Paraflavitalea sp. CAU 1676 TaxID=3032598 RepID=UPI0023D9C8F5|nr:DUF6717 family protein [Paraflavitalea sp. CAU 1676]MDF2188089.1 hypothetical protein [Paraflavitalea sp. CAU 1676]